MSISIQVDGYKSIAAKFIEVEGLSLLRLQEIVDQTATEVAVKAKIYCPVDTGRLMGSIEVKNQVKTATGASAEIGPNTDYESYVEYGTSKMGAQPYMRPAALDGEEFISKQGKIL